jgi:hypothetical protein
MTYDQFLEWLEAQDADSVLDLLGLKTEELLDKFDERAYEIWKQEYADEEASDPEV